MLQSVKIPIAENCEGAVRWLPGAGKGRFAVQLLDRSEKDEREHAITAGAALSDAS